MRNFEYSIANVYEHFVSPYNKLQVSRVGNPTSYQYYKCESLWLCQDVRMFVTLSRKNYWTDYDEIWYVGSWRPRITYRLLFIPEFPRDWFLIENNTYLLRTALYFVAWFKETVKINFMNKCQIYLRVLEWVHKVITSVFPRQTVILLKKHISETWCRFNLFTVFQEKK